MKLNAPKKNIWYLSLILTAVGVIAFFITIPVLTSIAFWLPVVGWLLLFLATFVKGM